MFHQLGQTGKNAPGRVTLASAASSKAMPPKTNCPVCGSDMRINRLLPKIDLRSYKVCPDCQSKYTVDADTKRREWVLLVFAVITFASAAAGFIVGFPWGFVSLFSGTGLLLYVGYAISKMSYVSYVD